MSQLIGEKYTSTLYLNGYKRGFVDASDLEDAQFKKSDAKNTVYSADEANQIMKQSEINKDVKNTFEALDNKYLRKDLNDSTPYDISLQRKNEGDADPNLKAMGNTVIGRNADNTLTVNATSTFKGDVTMKKDLTVEGDTTLGDLYVTGEAHFTNLTIDLLNSIEGALIVSCAHALIVKVDSTLRDVDYDSAFGSTVALSHFNFYASLYGESNTGSALYQNHPCSEFVKLMTDATDYIMEELEDEDVDSYFPSRIQNSSGDYTYKGFTDIALSIKAVRVYWKAGYNSFKAGDFVYSNLFDENNSQHYWSLICGVGKDSTTGYQYADILARIDGATFDADQSVSTGLTTINGNAIDPLVDEVIVLLGNNIDTSRQGAIILSAYDTIKLDTSVTASSEKLKAPYFALYKGINDFSFGGHLATFIARDSNKFTGNFEVGDSGKDIQSYIDSKITVPDSNYTYTAFCTAIDDSGNATEGFTINPLLNVNYSYMAVISSASSSLPSEVSYYNSHWFLLDTNTDITLYRLQAVLKLVYCDTSYTPATYDDVDDDTETDDNGNYVIGQTQESTLVKKLYVKVSYKILAIKGTTVEVLTTDRMNELKLAIKLVSDSGSNDINGLVFTSSSNIYSIDKESTNFFTSSPIGTYITSQLYKTDDDSIIASDALSITFKEEALFSVYSDLHKIVARVTDSTGNIATLTWTAKRIDTLVSNLSGDISEISLTASRILATVKGSTNNLLSNTAFKVTSSDSATGAKDWEVVNGGDTSIVDATINGKTVKALLNNGGVVAAGVESAPILSLINTSTDSSNPDLYTFSTWVRNISDATTNNIYLTIEYKQHTPSFDMPIVSSSIIAGNAMKHAVSGDDWVRISCVLYATEGEAANALIYSEKGYAFQVAMPMLQKGSYATDWVSADADYASYIDMQKDSIDAGVTKIELALESITEAQTMATLALSSANNAVAKLDVMASDLYITKAEKESIKRLLLLVDAYNAELANQYSKFTKDTYSGSDSARVTARNNYNSALDTLATRRTAYLSAYANATNAFTALLDETNYSKDLFIGTDVSLASSDSVKTYNNVPYSTWYSYLSDDIFFSVRTAYAQQMVTVAECQKSIWNAEISINATSINLRVTKDNLLLAGITIDGENSKIDLKAGSIDLSSTDGTAYMKADSTGVDISGKVTAKSGNIGGWDINENNLSKEDEDGSIVLLPSKLQGTDSLGTIGWQLNSDGSGFLARDAVSWNNNDGVTVKGNINASVFKVIDTSHSDRTLFEMTSLGLITDITAQQKASAGLDNADESTPILVCYQYATDGSIANRYIVNLTMIGGSALVNYKSFSIDCGAWDSLALMYNMDDYEQYEVPLEFQLTLKSKIYLPMFKSAGTYYSGDILALCDDSYYYSSSRVVPISTLILKMYDVYLKISVSNGGILDLLTACLYNNKTLIDSNDLDDLFSLTLTMAYSDNFYEELLNIVPTYSSIKNYILSTINGFSNTSTTAKFNSIVSDIVSIVLAQGVGITSSIESVYGWEYNHNVVKRVRFHFTEYSDDADIFLTLFYTPDY